MSLSSVRNLLIAVFILGFSNFSIASTASNFATASIDWDNLDFNFLDITTFLPITDPGDFSLEKTENTAFITDDVDSDVPSLLDFDFDSSMSWLADTQASVNFSNADITTAIANATATALHITSVAELESSSAAIVASDVTRTGLFTAASDGLMIINAPFTLLAEVVDGNLYQAYAEVGFSLTIQGSGSSDDIESISTVFTTESILESTNSGILAIAIPYENGDEISISAFAYAAVESANPVPVPATFWLLSSAMLMLVARKPFA